MKIYSKRDYISEDKNILEGSVYCLGKQWMQVYFFCERDKENTYKMRYKVFKHGQGNVYNNTITIDETYHGKMNIKNIKYFFENYLIWE